MKQNISELGKYSFLTIPLVTLIIIGAAIGGFLFFENRVPTDVFFPLDDSQATYTILCKEVYYLSYKSNENDRAIAISNAPHDLEDYCDQEVVVSGRSNPAYTKPICRDFTNLCNTTKSATYSLETISLK